MRRRIVLAWVLAFSAAWAQESPEETRLRVLQEKLRCLVCQNQTLADSSAELAGDLRREVREQVKAGRSDKEIIDFMVARYGDFVLYEPPFKASTILLWVGPFALLALALATIAALARRRREAGKVTELGEAERQLVERALGRGEEPK